MNDGNGPDPTAEVVAPTDQDEGLIVEAQRRFLDSLSFGTAAELARAMCSPLEFLKTDHSETLWKALSMAVAASYGRPFTVQNDRLGTSENKLGFPSRYLTLLESLDERSRELHARVLEYRHTLVAHSDASVAQIRFPDDPRTTYMGFVPTLSDTDAQDLKVLAETMEGSALERYAYLRKQLAKDNKVSEQ